MPLQHRNRLKDNAKPHRNSPRAYHVEVREGAEGGPEDGARLDSLDPEVVSEEHAEYGYALVVVGARHGATDVTGYYGYECSRHQPC